MKHIVAIDLGTSNCKAVIITEKAKVLKAFHIPTKPVQPKPGWNEQNPETVFNAVIRLLQQSIAFCGEENVACVSFSAAMHSLLAVDKSGGPLMNISQLATPRCSSTGSTTQAVSVCVTERYRQPFDRQI